MAALYPYSLLPLLLYLYFCSTVFVQAGKLISVCLYYLYFCSTVFVQAGKLISV